MFFYISGVAERITSDYHNTYFLLSLQASCSEIARSIQKYHTETHGWADIGYNFLIGGDGSVYIGRGWDLEGAHTRPYNDNSICMAFIGNYSETEPTKSQLHTTQKWIEIGVEKKKLTLDYYLYGQKQLTKTESPGQILFEIITKWEHWTEQIN